MAKATPCPLHYNNNINNSNKSAIWKHLSTTWNSIKLDIWSNPGSLFPRRPSEISILELFPTGENKRLVASRSSDTDTINYVMIEFRCTCRQGIPSKL